VYTVTLNVYQLFGTYNPIKTNNEETYQYLFFSFKCLNSTSYLGQKGPYISVRIGRQDLLDVKTTKSFRLKCVFSLYLPT